MPAEDWKTRLCRHGEAFRRAKAVGDGLAAHRAFMGLLAALDTPIDAVVEASHIQARRSVQEPRATVPRSDPRPPCQREDDGG
jgi:hypothetical protein